MIPPLPPRLLAEIGLGLALLLALHFAQSWRADLRLLRAKSVAAEQIAKDRAIQSHKTAERITRDAQDLLKRTAQSARRAYIDRYGLGCLPALGLRNLPPSPTDNPDRPLDPTPAEPVGMDIDRAVRETRTAAVMIRACQQFISENGIPFAD